MSQTKRQAIPFIKPCIHLTWDAH